MDSGYAMETGRPEALVRPGAPLALDAAAMPAAAHAPTDAEGGRRGAQTGKGSAAHPCISPVKTAGGSVASPRPLSSPTVPRAKAVLRQIIPMALELQNRVASLQDELEKLREQATRGTATGAGCAPTTAASTQPRASDARRRGGPCPHCTWHAQWVDQRNRVGLLEALVRAHGIEVPLPPPAAPVAPAAPPHVPEAEKAAAAASVASAAAKAAQIEAELAVSENPTGPTARAKRRRARQNLRKKEVRAASLGVALAETPAADQRRAAVPLPAEGGANSTSEGTTGPLHGYGDAGPGSHSTSGAGEVAAALAAAKDPRSAAVGVIGGGMGMHAQHLEAKSAAGSPGTRSLARGIGREAVRAAGTVEEPAGLAGVETSSSKRPKKKKKHGKPNAKPAADSKRRDDTGGVRLWENSGVASVEFAHSDATAAHDGGRRRERPPQRGSRETSDGGSGRHGAGARSHGAVAGGGSLRGGRQRRSGSGRRPRGGVFIA